MKTLTFVLAALLGVVLLTAAPSETRADDNTGLIIGSVVGVGIIYYLTQDGEAVEATLGDIGKVLGDIASPLLLDLAGDLILSGEGDIDLAKWWDENQGEALDKLLSQLPPKMHARLAEIQYRAEAGNLSLEEYLREHYTDELWLFVQERGGAEWLLAILREVNPVLGDWLATFGPRALQYGVDQGILTTPTIGALYTGWPPKLTHEQLVTLGIMAANAYMEVHAAREPVEPAEAIDSTGGIDTGSEW